MTFLSVIHKIPSARCNSIHVIINLCAVTGDVVEMAVWSKNILNTELAHDENDLHPCIKNKILITEEMGLRWIHHKWYFSPNHTNHQKHALPKVYCTVTRCKLSVVMNPCVWSRMQSRRWRSGQARWVLANGRPRPACQLRARHQTDSEIAYVTVQAVTREEIEKDLDSSRSSFFYVSRATYYY